MITFLTKLNAASVALFGITLNLMVLASFVTNSLVLLLPLMFVLLYAAIFLLTYVVICFFTSSLQTHHMSIWKYFKLNFFRYFCLLLVPVFVLPTLIDNAILSFSNLIPIFLLDLVITTLLLLFLYGSHVKGFEKSLRPVVNWFVLYPLFPLVSVFTAVYLLFPELPIGNRMPPMKY